MATDDRPWPDPVAPTAVTLEPVVLPEPWLLTAAEVPVVAAAFEVFPFEVLVRDDAAVLELLVLEDALVLLPLIEPQQDCEAAQGEVPTCWYNSSAAASCTEAGALAAVA